MDKKQEQVLALLETLEDATYTEKRKIAKGFGVTVSPPEVGEQLTEASVRLNHVPRNAEEGTEGRDYAIIPALHLGDGTATRPLWCRLEVAREVGEALVRLADSAEQ